MSFKIGDWARVIDPACKGYPGIYKVREISRGDGYIYLEDSGRYGAFDPRWLSRSEDLHCQCSDTNIFKPFKTSCLDCMLRLYP